MRRLHGCRNPRHLLANCEHSPICSRGSHMNNVCFPREKCCIAFQAVRQYDYSHQAQSSSKRCMPKSYTAMPSIYTFTQYPAFTAPTLPLPPLRLYLHLYCHHVASPPHFNICTTPRAVLPTTPHQTNATDMTLPNLKLKAIFFDLDGT